MKKRESNETTLKEAIDRLLKAYNLSDKMKEVDVVNSWEKIMGPTIAKHTKEIFIRNGKLVLRLDSSVLREELSYGKAKLIEHLNNRAGKVIITDVEFK